MRSLERDKDTLRCNMSVLHCLAYRQCCLQDNVQCRSARRMPFTTHNGTNRTVRETTKPEVLMIIRSFLSNQ